MESERDRPEPEALLAEAAREGRGRLKIFLGAAPGVGKTYAMLEEARRRRADGTDVVIGIVETHGRAETEALVGDLEILPRRMVTYRGRAIPELDTDAVVARHPQLILIDELAHSNVPGSTHVKRWQDVQDILEAGIDVYTTLNIQHIESLNDIVARISGVRVRETLPDSVVARADEIELIDLPPDELITRLRQGKVYVQEQIARAIQNFFSKGNLTALRELAMRVAADRVDAQMAAHMQRHAITGPWPTQDRLLVCVNESPVAPLLIRATKRMADRARAPWLAVHVVPPAGERLRPEDEARLTEALKLAEDLGAELVTLDTESDVVSELLEFARGRNVSRLVIGRPRPRQFLAFGREHVTQRLLEKGGDFEITVVGPEKKAALTRPLRGRSLLIGEPPIAYLWAAFVTVGAFAAAFAVDWLFPVGTLSLIFITGVLLVAVRFGLGPSLLASLMSFALYNYFFTEPHYTFNVDHREDILTLFLFLAVALITGNLAARVRSQAVAQRQLARRTSNLFDFSRKVAGAASKDDVLWAVVHHVAATLQCRTIMLLPQSGSRELEVAAGYPPDDTLSVRDHSAANWAWDHGEPAGWTTATLPTSDWLFLPLTTARGTQGILGVAFDNARMIATEQRQLLNSLADQVALALDRTQLVTDLEDARLVSETDRLRSALLSSVSHDLRTPLVSIIGAAATLRDSEHLLSAKAAGQLVETIHEEGLRLNRYIQNLLDMTRLGYGALVLKVETADFAEIVGRARRQLSKPLAGFHVSVDIASDASSIAVDPVLFEQVIANVLDNSSKYAPAGTAIAITAQREADWIVIAVEDQGPGIPEADRERVFDIFYRVRAGDGHVGGTGLGLAICRGIVEAHGGAIGAEPGSNGQGTRIVIQLPARLAEQKVTTDAG